MRAQRSIPLRETASPLLNLVASPALSTRLEQELRDQSDDHQKKRDAFGALQTIDPVANPGARGQRRRKSTKNGAQITKKPAAEPVPPKASPVVAKPLLPNAVRRFSQTVLYGTGSVLPLHAPRPDWKHRHIRAGGGRWDLNIHEPLLTATRVTLPSALGAADSSQAAVPLPSWNTTRRLARVEDLVDPAELNLPRGLKPKRKQHTTPGPSSVRHAPGATRGGTPSRTVGWADPNDDPSKYGVDLFTSLAERIMALDIGSTTEEERAEWTAKMRATSRVVQEAHERRATKGILAQDGDVHQVYQQANGTSCWANNIASGGSADDMPGMTGIISVSDHTGMEGISEADAQLFMNTVSAETANRLSVAALELSTRRVFQRDTLDRALGAESDPFVAEQIRLRLEDGTLHDLRGGLDESAGDFSLARPMLRDTAMQRARALERSRALAAHPQIEGVISLMRALEERALRSGKMCYTNHLTLGAAPLPDHLHPEMEAITREWIRVNGFLMGYLLPELRHVGARVCVNAQSGKCRAVEISDRARGRSRDALDVQYGMYGADLPLIETSDGAAGATLWQDTTDQVYFLDPMADGVGNGAFMMREFVTPREWQRIQDWNERLLNGTLGNEEGNPHAGLPGTCLLCELDAVCRDYATFLTGQGRSADARSIQHAQRPDLFLFLNRFEFVTGPGQYDPNVMVPVAFVSRDADNSRVPNRPQILGKFIQFAYSYYQLAVGMSSPLLHAPGVCVNRPILLETAEMDFRPVLSNINASFAGLPKWGWAALSVHLPQLPGYRTPTRVTPFSAAESADPFTLHENEQQAWFVHIALHPEDSRVKANSKNWLLTYRRLLRDPAVTHIPRWSTFLLTCPIGLQDGAWFARIQRREGYARLGSWTRDLYRCIPCDPRAPATTVIENLENLPLVLLRRFLLLRSRLALLLHFEQNLSGLEEGLQPPGHAPRRTPQEADELNEHCYFHLLYNPTRWPVARVIGIPEGAVDAAAEQRELLRWETIVAPFVSTLRWVEAKAHQLRTRLPDRSAWDWVHEAETDTWRRAGHTRAHEEWDEQLPILDIYERLRVMLPLELVAAAQTYMEMAIILGDVSARPDLISVAELAANGFSFLAALLYRLFHLHRWIPVARAARDVYLMTVVQHCIDELAIPMTTAVAHNAWSDAAWFQPDGVALPTRIRLDPLESSLAPDARLYARGFRQPKEIPFARARTSLAALQWPGLRAFRISQNDGIDMTLTAWSCGGITRQPAEYTSTQNIADAMAALAYLFGTKIWPVRSQKREDRSMGHRVYARDVSFMMAAFYTLCIVLMGNMFFVLERVPFDVRCQITAWALGFTRRLRRSHPNADDMEFASIVRTEIIRDHLYEPMTEKVKLHGRPVPGAEWQIPGARSRYPTRFSMQFLLGMGQQNTVLRDVMSAHPQLGVMYRTQQSIARLALRSLATRMQLSSIVIPTGDPLKDEAQYLEQDLIAHANHAMQTRLHGAMNKQLSIVVQKAVFWELLLDILNKFYNSVISKVIQCLRPFLVHSASSVAPAHKSHSASRHGKGAQEDDTKGGYGSAMPAMLPGPPIWSAHATDDANFGLNRPMDDVDALLNQVQDLLRQTVDGDPNAFFADTFALDNLWGSDGDPLMEQARNTSTQYQGESDTMRPLERFANVTEFAPDRTRTFNPAESPPTALHCYTLPELQRVVHMIICELMRDPVLDDPGREPARVAFTQMCYWIQQLHAYQQDIPLSWLGYYGLHERAYQILVGIRDQYLHGGAHNGMETTVAKLWLDYPRDVAKLYRALVQVRHFSTFRGTILPKHIADHQKRAVVLRYAHVQPPQVPQLARAFSHTRAQNTHTTTNAAMPPILDTAAMDALAEMDAMKNFSGSDLLADLRSLADEMGDGFETKDEFCV